MTWILLSTLITVALLDQRFSFNERECSDKYLMRELGNIVEEDDSTFVKKVGKSYKRLAKISYAHK